MVFDLSPADGKAQAGEKAANAIRPLKIGSVTLKNNLILAPLAGFTDIAFRRLCREFGAGLTVTEMVSVKGLCYNNENTKELLSLASNESPSCVQLFGSDPEFFLRALERPELERFGIVDINMGCPMPKVTKNGDGSALLKNVSAAAKIVEAIAKTGRTVTAKIRTGWNETQKDAVSFAKAMHSSGAAMLTVHGRTAAQMYSGLADWDIIGEVAAALKIPVIGNGDVKSRLEAQEKIEKYGVAGVMIGRGAIGNPWIFSKNQDKDLPGTVLKHIDYMLEDFPESYTVANMRKHLPYYLKGARGIKELKNDINRITKVDVLKERLRQSLL